MTGSPQRGPWLLVTACYWVFTLSDGALRMLVLLHLHAQGRTPWALALVLLPYEIAGVFTNLLGGWLGARFGQKATLLGGLCLQALACALLAAPVAWLTVPYVMATQLLSGVAKDLAKTAAKSYVARLSPAGDRGLFGLIAAMTGSKNAMKGLGFFAGGALLAAAGFAGTNAALAVALLLMATAGQRLLPALPGKPAVPWRSLLAHGRAIRWLAAARAFLFGSRDVWFAVALPVFLAASLGWSPALVGGFLSAWVLGYGAVQVVVPRLVRPAGVRAGAAATAWWTAALLLPLLATAHGLHAGWPLAPTLVAGLCAYGAVFATCSSLHSWLVVALGARGDVAERVGFYYAANSAGRLLGLACSGALFASLGQDVPGLAGCLLAAAVAVILAVLCTLPVPRSV